MATPTNPAPFRTRHLRWLLLPAMLLLLATSRPLAQKDLLGTAPEVPAGLTVPEAPAARFGENVNNQGCSAPQRLDLRVRIPVRNDGEAPIILREADAEIRIDGEAQPLEPHTYSIGGERTVVPFAEYEIAPGETEEVVVFSYAFMPKEALDTADRIEVSWPIGDETLRVVFEDVLAAPAVMR
jgi:hypothetical protein